MKNIQKEIDKKKDEYIEYLKQYLTAFEQVSFPVLIFEKELSELKFRLDKEPEEIIKALSGEKIPDVKTVTSTDYKEPDGAEDEKAIAEFDLNDLFAELEKEAYDSDFHGYHFKEANQIIRKHFEKRAEKSKESQMYQCICSDCHRSFESSEFDMTICPTCYA